MIGDKCLGVQPTWERPGISQILRREKNPMIPVPVMPFVSQPANLGSSGSAGVRPLLPSDKTRRGAVSEVMNFKVTMSQQDVEDKALRQALESGT